MAGYRQSRINEEMARVLSEAMRSSKDPRISKSMVSVTEVDCAKDLKNAKVYYSVLINTCTDKELREALKGASGYFRSALATKINLRETPVLTFSRDDSIERGARMSALINQVMAEDAAKAAEREAKEAENASGAEPPEQN